MRDRASHTTRNAIGRLMYLGILALLTPLMLLIMLQRLADTPDAENTPTTKNKNT